MSEWAQGLGIRGLFISAFVSATLAPGGSEAVLAYLAGNSPISSAALLMAATVGNTLGAVTTWMLGYLLASRYAAGRILAPKHEIAVERVRRWGFPVLLLSWLPLVGDGFCFASGWLRMAFLPSLLAIAVGKALRYAFVLWAFR
jgi:membrane protein YqaA with SNARE-associated domain